MILRSKSGAFAKDAAPMNELFEERALDEAATGMFALCYGNVGNIETRFVKSCLDVGLMRNQRVRERSGTANWPELGKQLACQDHSPVVTR